MGKNGDISKKKNFKDWLTDIKTIIGVIALIAALFGIKTWWDFVNVEFNTIIILDSSAAMNKFLPDGTHKYEAARLALQNKDFPSKENVGLRLFGGPCSPNKEKKEENTWLEIPPGKNNKDKILKALDARSENGLIGEAALTSAVREAVTNDLARFYLKDKRNRIIVIAAGAECEGDPADAINDVLNTYDESGDIKREIQLIGMGLTREQKDIFRQIAAVTQKKALFVNDRIDLEIALHSPKLADRFLTAKEKWLYKEDKTLTQDKDAAESLKQVVKKGLKKKETPFWTYEAMRLLGEIYLKSESEELQDEVKAIEQFGKSAEGGNSEARATLATLILMEKVPPQTYENAFIWLTQAADLGVPNAMYVLGRAYDDSTVWHTELESALKWYTKARDGFKTAAERSPKKSDREQGYKTGMTRTQERINIVTNKLRTTTKF